MMIEGSGSGSRRPKTYGSGFGSGSATPEKNIMFFSFQADNEPVDRFQSAIESWTVGIIENIERHEGRLVYYLK